MVNKREAVVGLITTVAGVRPGASSRAVKLMVSALPKIGAHSLEAHDDLRELLAEEGWKPGFGIELEPRQAQAARHLLPIAELSVALFPPKGARPHSQIAEDQTRVLTAARAGLLDRGREKSTGDPTTYRLKEGRLLTWQASELARHVRVTGLDVQVTSNEGTGVDASPNWQVYDTSEHLDEVVQRVQAAAASFLSELSEDAIDDAWSFSELLSSHPWTEGNSSHRELATRLASGWEAHFGKRQLDALAVLAHPDSLLDWSGDEASEWLCEGAVAAREFIQGWADNDGSRYARDQAVVRAWNRAGWRYGYIPVDDEGKPLPRQSRQFQETLQSRRPSRRKSGSSDSPDALDHPNEFHDDQLNISVSRVQDVLGADEIFSQIVKPAVAHAARRMLRTAQREYLTRLERVLEPDVQPPFRIPDPGDVDSWIFMSRSRLNFGAADAWVTLLKRLDSSGPIDAVPRPENAAAMSLPIGVLAVAQQLAVAGDARLRDWLEDVKDEVMQTAFEVVCQDRAPGPDDWPAIVLAIESSLSAASDGSSEELDLNGVAAVANILHEAATRIATVELAAGTVEGES